MNSGKVKQDYDAFKNKYNVNKQTKKHLNKSLLLSFIAVLTPLAIVYYITPYLSVFAFFLLEVLLCMVLMGPIIFYYTGRNDTKRNMAQQGYDLDWIPNSHKLFGWDTYHILRADPGTLQAEIMGFNNNPFSTSTQTLQKIEKKQRENATCTKCPTKMFDGRMFDYNGGYFVEKRKRFWFFGVPTKEKIIEWDAYCPEHKPEPHEYENA